MQSAYAERFDREMGCTEADWLMRLPAAIGGLSWQRDGSSCSVCMAQGKLELDWRVEPPRAIALVRMPRLLVHFRFHDVGEAQRLDFMKRFDLYMHRGGG